VQNVFAALARKAWQFAPDDSLPAWLYRTTLLEAKAWLRTELRRRRREQTAAELGTTMTTPDHFQDSRALLPLLDEALLSLREKDRTALLLRFYESRSLREVGAVLGLSEDATQKRVAAALERLGQFFQRRGFKTATLAATTAALEHTASAAPEEVAASVVQAALHAAPPAVGGLMLGLAWLVGLTRLQKAALILLMLAPPALWRWAGPPPAASNAPQPPSTPQIAVIEPAAPKLEQPLLPAHSASLSKPPDLIRPALPAPGFDKEYEVRVTGIVVLPDFKAALFEVRHRSLSRSIESPFMVKRILREGQAFDDMSVRGAHVRFELVQIEAETGTITARENDSAATYVLERAPSAPPPPSAAFVVDLPNPGLEEFVDFYAELLDRTALCYPAIKAARIPLVAAIPDRGEAIKLCEEALRTQGVATLLDGQTFVWLVPTNQVKTFAAALWRRSPPTDSNQEFAPKGAVCLINADLASVMGVYGGLIGRRFTRTDGLPVRFISFRNQSALAKEEVIYAFDTLLAWQGLKVQLVQDKAFKVVSLTQRH
jgi:RNA polymerase sigma factor (sigma-70 family)